MPSNERDGNGAGTKVTPDKKAGIMSLWMPTRLARVGEGAASRRESTKTYRVGMEMHKALAKALLLLAKPPFSYISCWPHYSPAS